MISNHSKSNFLIFLFMLTSLWTTAAEQLIDDGTTGEGLSGITASKYSGSADPFGDGRLLLKTSQGAKMAWYDATVKLPATYTISCMIKPKGNQSQYRVGLMGWMDVHAQTGIAVYIKPTAAFCVRSYDFTVPGDPESIKHLFQADGRRLGDIPATGYNPEKWATISMRFSPAKNKKMTARCDVVIIQGKQRWKTTFFTDLPLPKPSNHRFGYWGSYAGKTANPTAVGYVDNLTLHTATSFKEEGSEEIVSVVDTKSRTTIAQLATKNYRVEFFDRPFGFNVIKTADNTVLLRHSQTLFYLSGTPRAADHAINIQQTATSFEADLTVDGLNQPAHILVSVTETGLLKIQLVGQDKGVEKIKETFRDQGEEYYGVWEYAFGEKLSNRGAEYDLIGVKPGAHGMHSTNARAPFYMTSKGYGIYVDTVRLGRYAFAKKGQTRFEFEGKNLTWYFIPGKDYAALMQAHNQLAGSAFVPPDWALGTAWWRDDDYRHIGKTDQMLKRKISNAQDNVEATANNLQYHKIPASVIWIDRPFGSTKNTGGSTKGWGNMDFDPSERGFPNAQSMIDTVRKQGYELQIWIANRCNGQLKKEAETKGYIFTHNNLTDPAADVRIPAAYTWFQTHLDTYAKMGIKGYKIDRGHPQAETPRELENENVYLFTKLAAEGQRKRWGADSFVFSRNAFDKSRGYVGIWNGDLPGNYKGLQDSIRDGLRCGAINFPIFGSDTPGLSGGRSSADLFARWIQFSTYCTWMEINIGNTSSDRTIWYSDLYPQWLLDATRKQCETRFDLIPYTRSALYQATQTGIPVMQALIFAYPNDSSLVNKWDEYLYGSALLIAPVTTADATSRSVYLPAGKWLDYNDKTTAYIGPTTLDATAPKDSIPRFVKAGAIIPCGNVLKANNNWTKNWKPRLRIECFPAKGIAQTFEYFDKTKGIPIALSTTTDGTTTLQFNSLGTPGLIEIYCRRFARITRNGKPLILNKSYRWNAAENKLTIPFKGNTKIVIEQLDDL